ncbi:hypothetical protein [uncultured Winogradskyella sp.]|uniref:hypothetical protein n=1 Tax=uncultured Winogradskyella sp. TaxID=395353 RepID=UPI00260A89FD|nr:hypothetical protein [uncultured Winogradskyella sp.]
MRLFYFFILIPMGLLGQDLQKSNSTIDYLKDFSLSQSDYLKKLTFNPAIDSKNNLYEQYELAKMAPPTNGPNQFHIDFVGTANLQQNINEANEDVQGSAGLGVIFERYFLKKGNDGKPDSDSKKKLVESLDMEAYINVASSIDSLRAKVVNNEVTNQRLFGHYILNPVSPKQSIFINTNIYFNPELDWEKGSWISKVISGMNMRVNASNVLWNYNNGTDNISQYAGSISFRYGFFHEFLPNDRIRDDENKRRYSVRFGLYYGSRHVTGDISSEANNDLRNQFLGTVDKNYSGLEPAFSFRLNNIIAEFTAPMMRGSSESAIEGLTDIQFQFSIRFVGGFSLKVNEKAKNDDDDNDDDDDGIKTVEEVKEE